MIENRSSLFNQQYVSTDSDNSLTQNDKTLSAVTMALFTDTYMSFSLDELSVCVSNYKFCITTLWLIYPIRLKPNIRPIMPGPPWIILIWHKQADRKTLQNTTSKTPPIFTMHIMLVWSTHLVII